MCIWMVGFFEQRTQRAKGAKGNVLDGMCLWMVGFFAQRTQRAKGAKDIGFNEEWSGFVENKGIKGDYYSDGIFTVGAAHLFDKNFQVDASISANFKNTPSVAYANIGFSWRYDAKYQEVKIFSGKSKLDKKMIKNKEKVNKKNAKRLDQLDEKK